ncbi:MAG: hypothetical protein ACKO24_11405 [Leptolyngbyaceae cyanobacterium]
MAQSTVRVVATPKAKINRNVLMTIKAKLVAVPIPASSAGNSGQF